MAPNPDILIDTLGGTCKVAELFDIQPPSVSEWRVEGIPSARLRTLQLLASHRVDIALALRDAGYTMAEAA